MTQFSQANLFGITVRESANDGSDFTNPDADYRRLFLGEDGLLHVKDSAGAVTSPYTTGGAADYVTAHGARVKRSAASFSVGNNTLTAIEFDAEDFDTDTFHDNATNPSRLTIPSISGVTTGLWSITASGYSDVTSGRTDVSFRINAAANPASGTPIGFSSQTSGPVLTAFGLSVKYVLSAADYVECFLRTTGGAGNAIFDAGVSPIFEVAFLGKVT